MVELMSVLCPNVEKSFSEKKKKKIFFFFFFFFFFSYSSIIGGKATGVM